MQAAPKLSSRFPPKPPPKNLLALLLALLGCAALSARPAQAQTPPPAFGVIHSFQAPRGDTEGYSPQGALTSGGDGFLYGTTPTGGVGNEGTLFKVRLDGTGAQTIHSFSAVVPYNSAYPGMNADGAQPSGALTRGTDGFLYGAASGGGTSADGALFKVRPDGSGFRAFYSFSAPNSATSLNTNPDGAAPVNGLAAGGDGFFYGVTRGGGANGGGTVFQVSGDGSVFHALHSFTAGTDGNLPNGGLAAPGDGFLYGTVGYFSNPDGPNRGGSGGSGPNTNGTVFRVGTDGTGYQTLYTFGTAGGGTLPTAGLVSGPGGYLYGTTSAGGANGTGTIFKIKPDGSGFQDFYSLPADAGGLDFGAQGSGPGAGVTVGADGMLYGATTYGGPSVTGTLYRVGTDGDGFQTLHTFSARSNSSPPTNPDGANPLSAPVFGPDGSLYGTAGGGGAGGLGTLYRLASVHTHLLWDTADGRASLWAIDTLGRVAISPTYGPFDGGRWRATAMATGPDGRAHLLWSHPADGTYSAWDVTDPDKPAILPTYGPYPGWSAAAITVGSDGQDRLLWNFAGSHDFGQGSTGPAALWTIDAQGGFSDQLYGPYETWSTAALGSSSGAVSHLLWHNTGGQASLWTIGALGDVGVSPTYGPYDGGRWRAVGLAVGLQGERDLLWSHGPDSAASFWRVDASGSRTTLSPTYGPYAGFSCVALAADPAGGSSLLWSQPSTGKAALWALDAAGDAPGAGTTTQAVYGPFPDGQGGFWAPVAASAGP